MQKKTALLCLFLVLIAAFLLSFLVGRYPVSFSTLIQVLTGQESGTKEATAILNVRLPRILAAILVGMCLSSAGASYQGVFQNPMAAPDILGASAGAGFGAALSIYLDFSSFGITLGAFFMSLLTVFLVVFLSERTKGDRVLGLVLAGIMISSLFQAGTSFIKLVADPNNKLPAITYWLMGSLSGISWNDLKIAVIPMLTGLVALYLLRWRVNILTLGDDEAKSIGVDAEKVRIIVIIFSTLVTAASVALAGLIGWVGLVIPHMMRRFVGSDYRYLMPASMLGGGTFLLLVDDLSRNLTTTEIPIGILTAFIGAPFFIILITRRESSR